MKAVGLQAHNGTHFQHTRGIKLRIVFGKHADVVISGNQSTKHRVTLFLHVVSSPVAPPTSMGINVYGL